MGIVLSSKRRSSSAKRTVTFRLLVFDSIHIVVVEPRIRALGQTIFILFFFKEKNLVCGAIIAQEKKK